MARLFSADCSGNLSWIALEPDGSAAADPNTAGSLRPGSSELLRAAAWCDTLVVTGSFPAAMYVYDGQSDAEGPPVPRHTVTAFPADDRPMSVALSPGGQSVAIGTLKGEAQDCRKQGSYSHGGCVVAQEMWLYSAWTASSAWNGSLSTPVLCLTWTGPMPTAAPRQAMIRPARSGTHRQVGPHEKRGRASFSSFFVPAAAHNGSFPLSLQASCWPPSRWRTMATA
jgi:hypothetical protein